MASEGPSSSLTSPWKYHVFLSFRGQDTRKTFTDHLYAAFHRKGVIAFRDDEQLQRGEVISQELFQAIQQSLSAVIVLSPNYASSTWCLDELHRILQSKAELGLKAFPVFYGVDPSNVRHQSGSFAEYFRKHEERFSGDKEKVQRWRDALNQVANLSGWDSNHWHEAALIEDIVEKVWIELQPKLPSDNDGVVGIGSRVKEMDSLLSIGSEDVRFIGIYGMGGIGKTTLARIIYDRICSQFEISCFLRNVGEVSKAFDGLVYLQRKLLSSLKISNLEIDDPYDGKKKIRNLLCNKKVLLILDDISCLTQLENLAENQEWFGLGSRIIITTRDMHLLVSHGVCDMYEMKILSASCSLQLFSQKAFKRDQPLECYLELTQNMVQYAGGLPLALKVLGSFLCGRRLCQWKDSLEKIKQVPPNEILNTLRISYDGLDDVEKTIFLDIAFFFVGWKKVEVIEILKDCGFLPKIGISLLIEKSLVTCYGRILGMHDLLQEMGKSVVVQESPNDASKRSRLCSFKDIHQVLRKNKETEFIEGIILKSSGTCEADWDPKAFSKMCNLRVLIILCNLHLPHGLQCLSSSLKYLEWKGFPLQDLPLGLPLNELVHLKMHCSKLRQLWNGIQCFKKLKSIDLRYSRDLIQSPNIYGVPFLRRLILKGCKNLVEVHQSVAQHKHVVILNLEGCINLKTLPRKLEMNALKEFILCGCSQVKKLPEFDESMRCLSMLNLKDCKSLICLPNSIHNLKSLRILNIGGCSFSRLANNLNENNVMEEVDATETGKREVPSSCLKILLFKGRDWLITKPWSHKVFGFVMDPLTMGLELPSLTRFTMLRKLKLSYCNLNDGSIPDDIGYLWSLEELYLGGNKFVNLPTSIASLSRLRRLFLRSCPRLRTLPTLPATVYWLSLQNCYQLTPILFDTHRVWKIYEANRWKLKAPLWFIVPGSVIPAWFDNRDYIHLDLDPHLTDYDYDKEYGFIASIMVDIPDYCRSGEWWGIAVCLSLESNLKRHNHVSGRPIVVRWAFEAPDTKMLYPIRFHWRQWTNLRGNHLFITIFGTDRRDVGLHLRGDQKQVQLIIYGENGCKCGKLKLRSCGARVVYKEDQVWREGQAHSALLSQTTITEIEAEVQGHEQTASDFAQPNLHLSQRNRH